VVSEGFRIGFSVTLVILSGIRVIASAAKQSGAEADPAIEIASSLRSSQ
jgi:hypothetical protein